MKDTIYLLTSDGHKDSLITKYYCTSEQTLIAGVKHYYNEMFNQETKDFEVNFNKERIDFRYLNSINKWESTTLYFITINKWKNK